MIELVSAVHWIGAPYVMVHVLDLKARAFESYARGVMLSYREAARKKPVRRHRK